MNTLKLKLNPYKNVNNISLDDRPISSYSELSNFMKEPFLKWADKLLATAERELNDEYDLVVQAEEFERLFLQDLQNDFDACMNYSTEDYVLNLTTDERYKNIVKLASKYGIKFQKSINKITVYQDNGEELPLTDKGDINNSFLYILADESKVASIPNSEDAKIIVVPADYNKITTVAPMKFLWHVKEDAMADITHAIINRFVKVPAIVSMYETLQALKEQMDEEELEVLANSTEIDWRVAVKPIPHIEVGKTYKLDFKTIPEGHEIPPLTCVSLNPDIVGVEGNVLTALRAGQTVIEFYKADENVPFDQKRAITFKNNFVQKIEIVIPEKRIPVGHQLQISPRLIPADADDINSLQWSVSNTEVAVVSEAGLLTALKPGRITVIAKTNRAEAKSLEMDIIPIAQKVVLPADSITCRITDEQPFPVKIYPENCYDDSLKFISSDPNVANVEFAKNGVPTIVAAGIGDCEITFQSAVKGVSAVCKVTVTSKLMEESASNEHTWLCFTFGAFLITLLSSGSFAFMGAVATIALGFTVVMHNERDAIWAKVLMALAVIALLVKLVGLMS